MIPSWNTLLSDAWLDQETRALFEREEGFRPLAKFGCALEQDIEGGYSHTYEQAFKNWLRYSSLGEAVEKSLNQRTQRFRNAQLSLH